MDSDFCRGCKNFSVRLIENTSRGNRKMLPFRTVFMQLMCRYKPLAMEPVGKSEIVDDDYALLCEPNRVCSNIIDRTFLSKQMLDDYDDAFRRSCHRINVLTVNEIPEKCEYRMEQELSEMNDGQG